MKNKVLTIVFIVLITMTVSRVDAANKKADAAKVKAATEQEEAIRAEQSRIKAQEEKMAQRREAEKKANEALAGKDWQIEVVETSAQKTKPETDVLTFTQGKITSQNYSAKGYPSTNITLTLQDSGAIVWETMQTDPEQGTVFWRGELVNGLMSGAISLQPKKGDNKDYYFMMVSPKEKAEPAKIEAQEAEAGEAAATESKPVKTKKAPKKKSKK